MRISDWSSDVCSSDLGELAVRAVAAPCLAVAQVILIIEIVVALVDERANDRAKREAASRQRVSQAQLASPATVSASAVRFDHDPVSHRRARSEEHTSELQPLMRISSAVFCLKK